MSRKDDIESEYSPTETTLDESEETADLTCVAFTCNLI